MYIYIYISCWIVNCKAIHVICIWQKSIYVIWFTEGLKHEGSSNWRWKKQSSKCPPCTKTYYWNEFAKSHPRAQIPDLQHLSRVAIASFDCFWSFEESLNADYSRAWMENRVFQWQYNIWTTNASKSFQKVKTTCILVFSLHSFTHFGSLRGLLHPGWHVHLSFLTLFDTWNDLGAETQMTSLVPPSVSCGLQSSWHVQLLSPFAWPALPTQSPKSSSKSKSLKSPIYDNLCFLYPRTHQRVIVTWLLQNPTSDANSWLWSALSSASFTSWLIKFTWWTHQDNVVIPERNSTGDTSFSKSVDIFQKVTYGNIMNHLRVNHCSSLYPTTRSRGSNHINIKSHVSYAIWISFRKIE